MGFVVSKLEDVDFIEGDQVHVQRVEDGKTDHHKVMLDWVTSRMTKVGQLLQFYIRKQLVLLVNDPVLVERVLLRAQMKIPLNNKLDTTLHAPDFPPQKPIFAKSIKPSYNKFYGQGGVKMLQDRLRSAVNQYVDSGEPMPVWDVAGSFSLDYVYNVLFEIDDNFMENMDEYTELSETIEYIFNNFEDSPSALWEDFISFRWFDPRSIFTRNILVRGFFAVLHRKKWRSLRSLCENILKRMKIVHQSAAPNDPTFAPTFLKYVEEMKWTGDRILRELAVFMLAGHETTANAMCFLVYELARNDGLQEQCRAIVHPDFDPSVPRPVFELEHVIQESMRIHPVVSRPMLRTCTGGMTLKLSEGREIAVPPDVGILVNFYALHNSTWNWKDPEVFDPERHMDLPASRKLFEDGTRRGERNQDGLRFCPFSFGTRSCPGEKMAMDELQHEFEVFTEYGLSFADPNEKFKPRHLSQLSNVTMRLSKDVKILATRPIARAKAGTSPFEKKNSAPVRPLSPFESADEEQSSESLSVNFSALDSACPFLRKKDRREATSHSLPEWSDITSDGRVF